MELAQPAISLRQSLRSATAHAHDQLDGTMRSVAGWSTLDDYARFLSLQHAARLPIEAWLARHAPCDLQPPRQAPLIAQDLAQMDRSLTGSEVTFAAPQRLKDSPSRA